MFKSIKKMFTRKAATPKRSPARKRSPVRRFSPARRVQNTGALGPFYTRSYYSPSKKAGPLIRSIR